MAYDPSATPKAAPKNQPSELTRCATSPAVQGGEDVKLDAILDEFEVSDPAVRERVVRLAGLESSGNLNATGPKVNGGMHNGTRARGALQIMPATAKDYPQYDLNDPADATRAGLHYFLDNLNQFSGNLDAATIAHHAGPGTARKWLKEGKAGTVDRATGLSTDDYLSKITGGKVAQKAGNWWDAYPDAPAEEASGNWWDQYPDAPAEEPGMISRGINALKDTFTTPTGEPVQVRAHPGERAPTQAPSIDSVMSSYVPPADDAMARHGGFRAASEARRQAQDESARIAEIAARPDLKGVEREGLQNITEPVRRGLARARQNATMAASELGLYDGDQAGLATRLAQQQREVDRFPIPAEIGDGMQAISQAKTFGEGFRAIASNPLAVIETTLESLGTSAPALAGAIAGSLAGPYGTASGAALGSFAVEYTNTLSEIFSDAGLPMTDPQSWAAALGNDRLIQSAREKAVKRGLPIAAFDALTAGLAGRLLLGAKSSALSIGSRAAGEAGTQAAGGMAGEASAQALTGEFRPGDTLLEGFAEMPSAIVEAPGNMRHARTQAGDLTDGLQFDPRANDALARQALNPANAQETANVAPPLDAASYQGPSADPAGSAGLARDGGIGGAGSGIATGAPARSGEPGVSVGEAERQQVAGVVEQTIAQKEAEAAATGDHIELLVTQAESAAMRRAVTPQPTNGIDIDQGAILADVEAMFTDGGNLMVQGENAREAVNRIDPKALASALPRGDGALLVPKRFAGPVMDALQGAKQRVSVAFGGDGMMQAPDVAQFRATAPAKEEVQDVPEAQSLVGLQAFAQQVGSNVSAEELAALSPQEIDRLYGMLIDARKLNAEVGSDWTQTAQNWIDGAVRSSIAAQALGNRVAGMKARAEQFSQQSEQARAARAARKQGAQPLNVPKAQSLATQAQEAGGQEGAQESRDDLIARYSSAEPFSDEESALSDRLKGVTRKEVGAKINAGEMPVFETGRDTFATITPSAQQPGMFQVTRYNRSGVMGDSQYKSVDDALAGEFLHQKRMIPQAEAEQRFAEALQAESQYQARKSKPDISPDTITPNPAPAQAKRADKPKPKNLLQLVRQAGGVSTARIADVTGDRKRPGAVGVFTKGGMDLDGLAELLQQHGFMTEQDVSDTTSGAERATELLRQALAGERPVSLDDIDAEIALREEKKYRDRIRQRASELGIRTTARRFDDIEADVLSQEEQLALAPEDRSAFALDLGGYNEQTPAVQSFLDDAFDPFSEAAESQSTEDAMRALGFTEEEINAELQAGASPQEAGEADARGTEGRVASADARQADQGQGQQEGLTAEQKIRQAFNNGAARAIAASNAPQSVELELRAKSREAERDGDVGVVMGNGDVRFVSLADAASAARSEIDSGTPATPFQIHNATGIRIGDAQRVIDAAQQEANELSGTYTANERGSRARKNDGYTQDIFGDPLPTAGSVPNRNRQAAPIAGGEAIRAAGEVDGAKFATEAGPRVVGELKTAYSRIESALHAAHTLAGLRKNPQERFQVLVLDASNKPISVLNLFAGATTQTGVYPEVVTKAVYETPGAAKIWYAHNHPSGRAEASSADVRLTEALSKAFGKGTGIEVAGHVIIANDSAVELDADGTTIGRPFKIPAGARTNAIKITERRFKKVGTLGEKGEVIDSPDKARQMLPKITDGKSGVVFLNAQNAPVAFLPMTPAQMTTLRDGKSARLLFGAAARSNASAAMLHFQTGTDEQTAIGAADNIVEALHIDREIKVLDAFVGPDSLVHRGVTLGKGSNGIFASRSGTAPPAGLTLATLRQSISTRFPSLTRAVQSALRRGDEGQAGGVVVVERAEDLAGMFASKTGRSMEEVRQLLQASRSAQAAPASLAEVEALWDARGIDNALSEKNGIITLHKIIVPTGQRDGGIGTQAMRELIAYADRTGQQIALTPSGDFGGNKRRLEGFYRRLGFRTYKGFAVREKRIRDPEVLRSQNGDIQGFFDPKSKMVFMVGQNLTERTAPAVLLHEATHAKQREDIDRRALALIEARDKAVKPVRDFLNAVAARMESAGEAGVSAEAAAYIVEEAALAGRKAGFSAADGKLLNWIDMKFGKRVGNIVRDFVAMVRAWMLRAGVMLNPSIDDLVALAKLNVRDMGRGDVTGGSADGKMQSMSERNRVASEQAPNPAGDGMTGGAEPPLRDGFTRLYHGGNADLTEIRGGFGPGNIFGGVFASASRESAASHGSGVTYLMDIPEDKVLTQRALDYNIDYEAQIDAMKKAMPWVDESDIDAAYTAVIEDRSGALNTDDLMRIFREDDEASASWEAQRIRGVVATQLGYQAVEMNDEHGTSYLVLPGVRVQSLNEPTAPDGSGVRQSRASQTASKAFRDWFGDSTVVDESGKPLIVYHGTTSNVEGAMRPGGDAWSDGVFFTDSAQIASSVYAGGSATPNTDGVRAALGRMSDAQLETFAERLRGRAGWGDFWLEIDEPGQRQPYADQIAEYAANTFDDYEGGTQAIDSLAAELGIPARSPASGSNVIPSYLSLKNPLIVDGSDMDFDPEQQAEWIAQAKEEGNDGLVIRNYSDGGFGIGNDFRSAGRHDVYVAFRPEQVKSVTGSNGDFDPANPDIRFSRAATLNAPATAAQPAPAAPRAAQAQATPPDETRFQAFQRKAQDKLNRFTVIKEWLAAQGVTLSEQADVYKAEERMHSRFANKAEDFRERTVKPLVEKIQRAGYSMDDVAQYLHAQHAEERNIQVASINKQMPDGGSGMKTADANAILAAAPVELKRLANEFRAITERTKQILLDNGIISQDMADAWDATYQHYVPLKGGPEQGGKGAGKGLKANYKGKRALGHTMREEGEWIVENILADHERAIMLAEKNRVGQSLLKMAIEVGRDDLLTVGKPEKRGVLKNNTAYEVLFKGKVIGAFQSLEAARTFRATAPAAMKGASPSEFGIRKVSDPTVAYMASPMLADNEVNVYVKGQAIRVQINDDLLARAYGNMGTEALGAILRVGATINGYFSKIYTGYNPEFILTNIVRDFTTGVANVTGEEGAMMALRAAKDYPASFADLFRYATTGSASQWIRMYREDGGNTGAAYLSDLERLGDEISTEYAAYKGVLANLKVGDVKSAARAAGRKAFDKTLVWVERINQAGENAMRLSIYKAMIESGKSRAEAASLAKNATVNFNRNGEVGRQMNALWLFYNAGAQGTAAIAHANLKGRHKWQARAVSAGILGLGYTMAVALGAGDDEDDYDKLSDYTKARNVVIKTGDGWLKIPVPYGYGFFWNMGRAIADAERKGEWGKAPWHVASSFIEEFTPFGAAFAGDDLTLEQVTLGALPTLAQIPASVGMNRTTMGGPMYPESAFDKYQPDNEKMWRATKGTIPDMIAQALDQGGIEVSPETIKYLTRTFTGGAGQFVTSIGDAAWLTANGASLEVKEQPFVRKFYTETDVREARSAYYAAVAEAEKAVREGKSLLKMGDHAAYGAYRVENQEFYALDRMAKARAAAIKARRNYADAIRADKSLSVKEKRDRLKAAEAKEQVIYDRYLEVFKSRTRH